MKKNFLLIIVIFAFILLIAYFYFNKFNFNDEIDYSANKISTQIENTNIFNNVSKENTITEQEISNFYTKIIDKDNSRDTNIKITCNEINGTVIKNGEEFSFNKIAGNPTPDRGYKEAGIIVNGELKKGYGGRKLSGKYYNI